MDIPQLAAFLMLPQGRTSRAPFLVVMGALIAIALIFRAQAPAGAQWFVWVLDLPLAWVAGAVTARRLHDRGRSGWWALLVLAALLALFIKPQSFFAFAFVLVLIWAFIELGLVAGEMGENRFGAPPQAPWRSAV